VTGHTHVLVTRDGHEDVETFPDDAQAVAFAATRPQYVAVYTSRMNLIYGRDDELGLRQEYRAEQDRRRMENAILFARSDDPAVRERAAAYMEFRGMGGGIPDRVRQGLFRR
jgi:hypothetical protein